MTPTEAAYLKKALPQREAPAGGTYRLRDKALGLSVGGYVTKAIDRSRGTVPNVLTYPGRDYDGDTINPARGDWRKKFPANPVVNWTHRVPIGRGSVPELKSFDAGGEKLLLPVGTTHFFQSAADTRGLRLFGRDETGREAYQYTPDECLHAAASSARLVYDGIADGVSMEFEPDGPLGEAFWETGQESTLLRRPEYHWEKWVGLGWAHALQGKNPNAAVIQDKAFGAAAFRIAQTGTFPGGEKISPIVMKAFLPLKGRKPKYIRVERKAMADEFEDAPAGVDVPAEGLADGRVGKGEAGTGMKPTPEGYMAAIQHALDGVAMIEAMIPDMEHEKGIDGLQDHVEELKACANGLKALGKKLFPDAGFESPDATPESDPAEVETNDDGAAVSKAFPAGYPVRFRVAEGGGFERVEPPAPAENVRLKALAEQVDRDFEDARRERRDAEKTLRLTIKNH